MGDTRVDFAAQVARLAAAARRDLVMRRLLAGLFFGLLPALGIAAAAGTLALPVPAWSLAAAAAFTGLAAGAVSALLARPDRMRLLIRADAVLGSRELASTALELSQSDGGQPGRFTDAVLEDATRLLAGAKPRAILGRLRLPLAPFAALAALLAAAALVFPVDLRMIFPVSTERDRQMARIGDELRERGERLAERARGQGLDRSIELSRQLAQLGSDLAARKVTPREALERMSQLESGFQEEYQLRLQQMQLVPPGAPGPGNQPGNREGSADARGKGAINDEAQRDSADERGGDGTARDLADTLDKLRQAQRDLAGPGSAQDRGQGGDASSDGKGGAGSAQGDQPPGPPGQDKGPGREGKSESADQPGGPGGGAGIGREPAPEKRGAPSSIVQGDKGPNLQAPGNAAGEDSLRLLARTLPQRAGARLPEKAILNEYSRQAESALAHDEVPLKLRQSVKQYFTVIGISK